MENLFHSTLLMSLAGSIVFVLFKAAKVLIKSRFSASWYYRMLVCTIILFLIPIAKLGGFFSFNPVLQSEEVINSNQVTEITRSIIYEDVQLETTYNLIEKEVNQTYSGINLDILSYIAYAWILGVFIFTLWQVICFVIFERSIKNCEPVTSQTLLNALEQYKKQYSIKAQVKLRLNDKISTPMLVGLFTPTILLPSQEITEDEARYILSHELIHLKRKDLWIKIGFVMINAIHWFNPLVYILRKDLDEWCEYSCDELVVRDLDKTQRKQYGLAILNSIKAVPSPRKTFGTPLIGGKNNLERRLTIMLNSKKMKTSSKILSVVMAVAMLSTSAVTILAKEPVIEEKDGLKVIWSEGVKRPESKPGGTVTMDLIIGDSPVTLNAPNAISAEKLEEYINSIKSGAIKPLTAANLPESPAKNADNLSPSNTTRTATTADGKSVAYSGELSEAYANCAHNYQGATLAEHSSYSDGSCTTNYFDALICQSCNTIWVLEFSHSTTQRVCKH